MKKQIHTRGFFIAPGIFKSVLFKMFLSFTAIPKLILEAFLKKKMGERHFSMATAIIWATILFAAPFYFPDCWNMPAQEVLLYNWCWYLFTLAFCFFAVIRLKESWRETGVFDLDTYSRSMGFSYDFFDNMKWRGKRVSTRNVDIVCEPLAALLAGILICLLFDTITGSFIIFCAICYSLYYMASYKMGDDMTLDMLDDVIRNKDRSEALNTGRQALSGYKFMGEIPESEEIREMLDQYLKGDDDEDQEGVIA